MLIFHIPIHTSVLGNKRCRGYEEVEEGIPGLAVAYDSHNSKLCLLIHGFNCHLLTSQPNGKCITPDRAKSVVQKRA